MKSFVHQLLTMATILVAGTQAARAQDAQQSTTSTNTTTVLRVSPDVAPKPHPLTRALTIAREHRHYIQHEIQDYTCVMIKRERIGGELRPPERMLVKCRHERRNADGEVVAPFAVYLKFTGPRALEGREVLHVSGEHRGDMLVRKGGTRNAFINWWVDPHGPMALRDNRYPITEFGIAMLTQRLVEVAQSDLRYGECQVDYFEDAKVDGRSCLAIEVRHPIQRDHFRFSLARVFIDNELHIPIHYSAYSWPKVTGDPPPLEEQYTYRDVQLNVGLSDADFDRRNPAYGFRKD